MHSTTKRNERGIAALATATAAIAPSRIDPRRLFYARQHAVAAGSFGVVRVARLDGASGPKVAVKQVKAHSRGHIKSHEEIIFGVTREVKAQLRLRYPHVLPLLGYHISPEGNEAILVTPFLALGNAVTFCAKTVPSLHVRGRLVADVAAGLIYLHTRSPPITHGDLKGENVLITTDPEASDAYRAVICDFGLARAVGPSTGLTAYQTVVGTREFMSPELFKGFKHHSKESDVWAYACTALQILADRRPFARIQQEPLPKVVDGILSGMCPASDRLISWLRQLRGGDDVADLLLKCWSLSPTARPSVYECFTVMGQFAATRDGLDFADWKAVYYAYRNTPWDEWNYVATGASPGAGGSN